MRSVVGAARDRAGVVVVTHDAEEFLEHADRAVLLAGGRVAFDGPVDTLVQEPERFAEAGLRVPEVLRAQMLARASGVDVSRFELDPASAARALGRPGRAER